MRKRLTKKQREKIIEKYFGKIPEGRFEPGIYNYCDRWCERCVKRDKCFLYAEELKENADLVKRGINPRSDAGMLESIKNSFAKTKGLISDIAQAEGINLAMLENDDREYKQHERLTDPSRYKITKDSRKLFEETFRFLGSLPDLVSENADEQIRKIAHYAPQISVKIHSALSGKLEAKIDKGDVKFHLEDSFKRACVAYRGAEICRDALRELAGELTDQQANRLADQYDEIILQIDTKLLSRHS